MIVQTIDASTKTIPAVNLVLDEADLSVIEIGLKHCITEQKGLYNRADAILSAIKNRRQPGEV